MNVWVMTKGPNLGFNRSSPDFGKAILNSTLTGFFIQVLPKNKCTWMKNKF